MDGYLGDFPDDQTVRKFFTTKVAGAATSLLGTPVVKVYKDGSSTTEVITGVTLTVDFDGITGLNLLEIATTDAFYAAASDYKAIITTGTLSGTSIAPYEVLSWSCENRDTKADVRKWLGTAVASPAVAGVPSVDAIYIESDGDAASNAKLFFTTGYVGTGNTIPTVTTVNGLAANVITAASIAANAITAAKIATDAIDADALATDAVTEISPDIYYAAIHFERDQANSKDEYTITWFKNGAPVTSGITVPTIQVIKRADGTNLVAAVAMTQIGSTGSYKYDESTNRVTVGESVVVALSATIDAGTRTWRKPLGRDST